VEGVDGLHEGGDPGGRALRFTKEPPGFAGRNGLPDGRAIFV
jgi:hypothetical protein